MKHVDHGRILMRYSSRVAAALAGVVLLSGCGSVQIARPENPEVSPPVKVAVGEGKSAEFLADYTEKLDATLGGDKKALDQLQTGPLLDRTKAEVQIADDAKEKLNAMTYSDIVAGAPQLGKYPLWFLASATPSDSGDTSQLMLVTRQSAGESWKVAQSVFVPKDQAPAFLGGAAGEVELAGQAFKDKADGALGEAAAFLANGTEAKDATLEGDAFDDYRKYQDDLKNKDRGFDDVKATCEPYTETDLTDMALATADGAVALGEVRCTLDVKVPKEYALNMGDAVESVMSTDTKGSQITVVTSHPLLVSQLEDGSIQVVNDDWNLVTASTK